jgi:hypothetical protein
MPETYFYLLIWDVENERRFVTQLVMSLFKREIDYIFCAFKCWDKWYSFWSFEFPRLQLVWTSRTEALVIVAPAQLAGNFITPQIFGTTDFTISTSRAQIVENCCTVRRRSSFALFPTHSHTHSLWHWHFPQTHKPSYKL